MTSTEEWKKAYKEIHGKTPTKKDMRSVAPASVKRNVFGTENPPEIPEKGRASASRPVTISLKRPADVSIPIPKAGKRKKPNPEPVTPKKLNALRSPFKVFSPHRLPNSNLSSISPLKRFNERNASRSLFASPQRPMREITLTNVSVFIEQEEREMNGEYEEEEEEQVPDMFEDETQVIEEQNPGLLEREANKPWNKIQDPGEKTTPFRAAVKDNFVKLNMRKKTFVRGSMSASAKRKKVRKHKWSKLN
ncbi:hypothetical protein L596_024828 [Steinernema carpocapsae]|uniref:Uncharacterized protein n=1 Tax=Steinernema carpocapsae TaxID=34508 RepID=A0A4U5M6T3_STECR|nr:hypothetical protein L596_024828 [Steinernema carpocapsae]